jgi:hypothetical protein
MGQFVVEARWTLDLICHPVGVLSRLAAFSTIKSSRRDF